MLPANCGLYYPRIHSATSKHLYIFPGKVAEVELTPWSRVLLEKLTDFQLPKKFPAFYGTWMFITALTTACHLFVFWTISIQYMPAIPLLEYQFLVLSSHLCLGLPVGLFHSGFLTNTLYTSLLSPICATFPAHLIFIDLITLIILVRSTDH